MAAPMIVARQLACRRGERLLFDGLDLRVQPGQLLWLRGANGAGKTTLLRTLAGLSRPERGELRRDAEAIYIAHANALKDDLTVTESLAFFARLRGGGDASPAALRDALARFGLATRADAPVRTLSQGLRRRTALAQLGLPPPAPLWLLDEPFDALDRDGTATLNELLRAHANGGGAAIIASHQALTLRDPEPVVFELDAEATAIA